MSTMGIDLGTSTTQGAIVNEHGDPELLRNDEDEAYTPSVVFFPRDGSTLVGREALHETMLDPRRGIQYWKRSLGASEVLHTTEDGHEYRAKDLATILIRHMAQLHERRRNRVLSDLVIAHPHVCSQQQKEELRQAARDAGLNCTGLIAEPNAAALGNRLFDRGAGHRAILIDVGGGSTDCTFVENSANCRELNVISTSGDFQLGGSDFTAALMKHIASKVDRSLDELAPQERQHLWERAEHAKRVLSTRDRVPILLALDGKAHDTEIARSELLAAVRPLIDRVINCAQLALDEAGPQKGSPPEIIFVGGGSCLSVLQEEIGAALKAPISQTCNPHFAVALGTLFYARLRHEEDGKNWTTSTGRVLPPAQQRIRDRTVHPVGVATLKDPVSTPSGDADFVNSVILKKGLEIPNTQRGKFESSGRGGTSARVVLVQGEDGAPLPDCHRLGEFLLEDLPPVFDKPHPITVEFTIDRDGQITAVASSDIDPTKRADLVVESGPAAPQEDSEVSA